MPSLSNIQRAAAATNAKYTEAILNGLADDAEDEITAELQINGLDINPTPTPLLLKKAAQNWLCRNILRLQKLDGTAPNSMTAGSQSASVTIDQSITDYDVKGRGALDQYINTTSAKTDDDGDCLFRLAGE